MTSPLKETIEFFENRVSRDAVDIVVPQRYASTALAAMNDLRRLTLDVRERDAEIKRLSEKMPVRDKTHREAQDASLAERINDAPGTAFTETWWCHTAGCGSAFSHDWRAEKVSACGQCGKHNWHNYPPAPSTALGKERDEALRQHDDVQA